MSAKTFSCAQLLFMISFADAALDPLSEIPVSHPKLLRDMRDALSNYAALLADAPDVERIVYELQVNYSYFITEDTSSVRAFELFRDAADALESLAAQNAAQQARIRELEARLEVTATNLHGDTVPASADGISCRDDTIKLQDERIKELEGEIAKLKGHAETMHEDLQQANNSGEWGFISHLNYRRDYQKEGA